MNFIKKLKHDNINYLINRLIKGPSSLANIASNQVEVCPAQKGYVEPSFFFSEEMGNILRYHPETNVEIEMQRIKGGEVIHDATICWEIKDAYIIGNNLYKNNYKKTYPQLNDSKSIKSSISEIESTGHLALTSSYQGVKYFGHWLRDDVVTYLLAAKYGLPISFQTEEWADKPLYSKIFDQNWEKHYQGRIHKLFLFQDYAQNSYRQERYKELRRNIRKEYFPKNPGGNVYLKRGLTGNNIRNLTNEDFLINTLEKLNFIILDITKDPLEFIIENLMDANLVITIEGSHQNHALYTLGEGGSLIIIQPPSMFNNSAKDWCNILDFKHGITICKSRENGFEVNIHSVLKLIEFMKV